MADTTSEDDTDLIRDLFTALEEKDEDLFYDIVSEDFIFSPAGLSAEEYLDDELAFYEAFPDLTNELDMLFAGEGFVAFRWTFRGTHSGGGGPGFLSEYEATDKEVDVTGINIARVENGQIAEMWAEWDTLTLCHQLGIVEFAEPAE